MNEYVLFLFIHIYIYCNKIKRGENYCNKLTKVANFFYIILFFVIYFIHKFYSQNMILNFKIYTNPIPIYRIYTVKFIIAYIYTYIIAI